MLYLCPVEIKSRLSKSDLARVFGLVSSTGTVNYVELRSGYFTNAVLKQIGITQAQYKKIKRFSYDQSLKIIKVFELEWSDFKVSKTA